MAMIRMSQRKRREESDSGGGGGGGRESLADERVQLSQ